MWNEKRLKEIAVFNPRETLKKGAVAKRIAMEQLQPFCRDVSAFDFAAFNGGTKFRNGDTIMARITPCLENGKMAKINVLNEDEVGFGSTEYIVLRAREEIDEDFLYYLIYSSYVREAAVKSMVGSSGRQRVQTSVLENLLIRVPPYREQQKIGRTLKDIDDKIAYNRAINKNLEEQARAIFDSFYLKSEDKVPFTQMIKVLGGGTPKTTERAFWCGQIPFFTPKDVGNPYVLETEKYVTELGLTNCNSRLYPVNTTFVTARGTVGKVSLAGIPMAMNQSCYALMSDALHPFMTYFYTLHTVKTLQHKATGAVFDAIVTSDFDSELLHRIPEDDALQLLRRISPMMENIRVNVIGNLRLTELRDALLPRLMSGEIDVSNITL